LKLSRGKRRLAISEIMGTLIMIAVTLVAGAAVFGWVNGQAGSSESAYNASAAGGINYLREHFSPVTYTFAATGGPCTGNPKICTIANFWVFNNGQLAFTLATLQIQSAVGTPPASYLNIIYTATGFTAYNSAGTHISCVPSTPGFSGPASPIPVSSLGSPAYTATIPSCVGVNSIFVGQNYAVTMTGLYGNVVTFQLTANG
jgi:flagellin-like protein